MNDEYIITFDSTSPEVTEELLQRVQDFVDNITEGSS